MKYIPVMTFLLLGWFSSAYTQIHIDTITTDTIDIFSRPVTDKSSSSKALWITPILPGIGHQLVNRPKSALSYLTIDIISLFSALALHHYSSKTLENAKALAYQHAAIQNIPEDDYFWQIIGSFNSYSEYHQTYSNDYREFTDRLNEPEYYWKWGEKELYREDYNTLRKDAKRMSTISAFFVGAMILNRLVAFIDLRSSIKNQRFSNSFSISFSPITVSSASGVMMSTSF